MSANRVKALIKEVRGKNGMTVERLHSTEVLIALSMLLDPKMWKSFKPATRKSLIKTDLLPLMLELNACMWQAIGEFYDMEVTVDTEITFNKVRCHLSELRQSKEIRELIGA